MNTAHVWRAALERLRRELSRAQFDTWLRGTQLVLTDGGDCVLRVRTTFAKDMLETRYRDRIEAAIAEVSGEPCALQIAVIASANDDSEDEDEGARRTSSRRMQVNTDSSDYDRPALFEPQSEPAPQASRAPSASSPRQSLPPAVGANRSGRLRAAIDRNRAQQPNISGGSPDARGGAAGRIRPTLPDSGSPGSQWTDGANARFSRTDIDARMPWRLRISAWTPCELSRESKMRTRTWFSSSS